MKCATGAGLYYTLLLLLLCFLEEGVLAAVGNGAVNSHERPRDNRNGADTKTVKMARENGNIQHIKSAARDHSSHVSHSEETRSVPKVTHTTTVTRNGEGHGPYTYHQRSSGNGVTADEKKNERTVHYHHEGDTTERAHPAPKPARSHDVHKREDGNSDTRDDTTTIRNGDDGNDTTSQSRTHERHSSTGMADVRERPAPKTSSHHPSSEERAGGEEEESTVQTKTEEAHPIGLIVQTKTEEAHPIGLINALEGRAKEGRSIDFDAVNAREMDTTTTIIASALIGFACLIFILFCVAEVAKKRREKKADSTRLLRVFQYLHEFNVDDIDIQLSAAGGFHVGYLNGLAQGINTKKQPDQKTDTSSDEGEGSSGLSKKV